MPEPLLRVLIVDDSDDDAELVGRALTTAGTRCACERVDTADGLARALATQPWDVIVTDWRMPQFSGTEAVRMVRRRDPFIPLVVVSGEVGEERAAGTIRAGADEFLRKDNLTRLPGAIERAQRVADARRQRQRAEEEHAALLAVATDIAGTLDLGEILERVHRRLLTVLHSDCVLTYQWMDDTREFHLLGSRGVADHLRELAAVITGLPYADVMRWLYSARTIAVHDVSQEPWVPATWVQRSPEVAFVGIPLIVRAQPMGAMVVARTRGGDYAPHEVHLFERAARQVALALGAVQSHEAAQVEARVAATLARAGHALVTSRDPRTVLDRLCAITVDAVACDSSRVMVWDAAQEAYVVVANHGDSADAWEATRLLAFHQSLLGERLARLADAGIMEADADALRRESPAWAAVTGSAARSLLVALHRDGALTGVLTAERRDARDRFQPWQRRVALGIGQLGTIALENARLFADLTKANNIKSEFVAAISHELRTPLNVILGYHDLLTDAAAGLSPDHREMLAELGCQARHLADLIAAVLDLSRLEAGRAPVRASPVPLPTLLHELAAAVRHTHPHAAELAWQVEASATLIHSDPVKLRVLLRNLLDNAVKFTAAGAITLAAAERDHGVEFLVADTGIGIAPEAREVIFQPFRQGDGSLTRRYGGIGLGLYVVQRLVEVLGGHIAMDSTVGDGTRFRVWIPDTLPHTAAAATRPATDLASARTASVG